MVKRDVKDWQVGENYVLDFDFIEEERKSLEEYNKNLKEFDNPKNEQEELFNLQKRYRMGDDGVLYKIYILIQKLCIKIMCNHRNEQVRHLCDSQKESVAIKVADAKIKWLKKYRHAEWAIEKSWYSCLMLAVETVLFRDLNREVFNFDIELYEDSSRRERK